MFVVVASGPPLLVKSGGRLLVASWTSVVPWVKYVVPRAAKTFVIPPSDEWRGFGDLSCVRLCLPLLVFASRCKAGKYQRYAFNPVYSRALGMKPKNVLLEAMRCN